MKNYTILKWWHYSINFFPCIFRLTDERVLSKTIEFTESCKYEIDEPSCVNKLFGFCFGLLGVHKNSCRFGWTYDAALDEFVLWTYCYKNGKLEKHPISDVKFNPGDKIKVTFKIQKTTTEKKVGMYINDMFIHTVSYNVACNWLFTLGFYFGGNTRAPHKMTINKVE